MDRANDEHRGWDYQAIGWLLEKVQEDGGKIPLHFFPDPSCTESQSRAREARLDFGHIISMAFTLEKLYPELTGGAKERSRKKKLDVMFGQLKKLSSPLKNDEILASRLSLRLPIDPETGVGLFGIIQNLDRLSDAIKAEADSIDLHHRGFIPTLKLTPQELLLTRLRAAYCDGLSADHIDGLSKTWSAPKGPFVTFLYCSYQLAGRPKPAPETLYKALDRAGLLPTTDKG